MLKDQNCDTGQGFLFARPLTVSDTEDFLEGAALKGPVAAARELAQRKPEQI